MYRTLHYSELYLQILKNVQHWLLTGWFCLHRQSYRIMVDRTFGKNLRRRNPYICYGLGICNGCFGIIASILFLLCFAGTKERITPVKENNSTLKNDLKDLFANKPWWILLGAGVATLLFNTIRDGVAIYYFKYYLNKTDTDMISFSECKYHLQPHTLYWDKPQILLVLLQQLL